MTRGQDEKQQIWLLYKTLQLQHIKAVLALGESAIDVVVFDH